MSSTGSTLRIDNTCAAPGCRAPRDRWLTLQLLIALPLLTAAMKLFEGLGRFRQVVVVFKGVAAMGQGFVDHPDLHKSRGFVIT